jgi:periplasmic protein TonB
MKGLSLLQVDFPGSQPGGRSIWLVAATAALLLHVALGAFAIARLQEAEDDDLGAPGVEIDFELASPRTPSADLPPGPDSDATVASPPVIEQKTTVKEPDLPKETPVEAEEPDRLVTIDNPKKPEEVEPDVKAQNANPSEESVAQEATAAPAIESAPEAAKSVTRQQGTGESRQRARVTWQKELIAHLDKHKRYPVDRSQKSVQMIVTFELDRVGHVRSASIATSSGDPAFDAAALTMVRRSDPVPPPPPLIADEGLMFSLPVIFRMNGKR